jgi:hypothetical protein
VGSHVALKIRHEFTKLHDLAGELACEKLSFLSGGITLAASGLDP